MNHPKIVRRLTERTAVCRLCEKPMGPGVPAVVLEAIHVSPKVVDLFFHPRCLPLVDDAKPLVSDP